MDFIDELVPLPSGVESYLGFFATLGLFIAMLLLMNFIFALVAETYRWTKNRSKGEAYTFHYPNPVTAIKNWFTRARNWFTSTIKKIKTAVQAIKDIRWLIAQNIETNIKTKHAFLAYSTIVFVFGVTFSEVYDHVMKFDLFSIISKAF